MKKNEFNEILKKINLSRQEFADMTSLSYGSVSNWNDGKQPVPGWVESWLQNYIKAKDIDKVAETMRPYIECGEK